MESLFKITNYDTENPKESFEIDIKGKDDKVINTVVKASKILIESIDVKHVCDEDYELFEDSIKKILLSVADVLVAEGWEIEEETEKARLDRVALFINNLRYKDK